jgi:drug/metabolite transporter (DMT)-like permease
MGYQPIFLVRIWPVPREFFDMRPTAALFTLLTLAALWGASFLFMRVAAPEFGPIPLIALRVTLAALALLPLLLTRPRTPASATMRVPVAPMFLLGITNSALPFTLFAYATLSLSAGLTAILNATAPFFTAIIAALWLRDPLIRPRALGLIIGFAGVILVVWGRVSFKPGAASTGLAVLAGLTAALCYGFAANYTKRRFTGIDPLRLATYSQATAAIALLPLALFFRPATLPSTKSWAMLAALAVLSTALAYVLYFRLIAALGPARAVTVTFLIPVFAMIWGMIFLQERITLQMIAGTALILSGIAITTRRPHRPIQ